MFGIDGETGPSDPSEKTVEACDFANTLSLSRLRASRRMEMERDRLDDLPCPFGFSAGAEDEPEGPACACDWC